MQLPMTIVKVTLGVKAVSQNLYSKKKEIEKKSNFLSLKNTQEQYHIAEEGLAATFTFSKIYWTLSAWERSKLNRDEKVNVTEKTEKKADREAPYLERSSKQR